MGRGLFSAANRSRFDVADLKGRDADDEKSQAEAEQDAEGFADLPPRDVLLEEKLPGVEVIAEKTFFEVVKVGDFHQNAVNQDDGECQNGGGGGLHVEAGEHKGQTHDGAGFGDHEKVCEEKMPEAVGKVENTQILVRHLYEESAAD